MTRASATRAINVRDVARTDQHDEATAPLDHHVEDIVNTTANRAGLRNATRRSVDTQVRAAIDGALERDVVSVLAATWQASRQLTDAARATAARPGTRQIVTLASQSCVHCVRPIVRVLIDGVELATVTLAITVELTFCDLAASVSAGAVVGLEFDRCDIAVSIHSAEGTRLLHRSVPLTSGAQLPLPRPVPLVRSAPART